jgi:ribosomal protein L7/L12
MPRLNHVEMDRFVDALRALHGMNAKDHISVLLRVAKDSPKVFYYAVEEVHNTKPIVDAVPRVEMYKVIFSGFDEKQYTKLRCIRVYRELTGKGLYDSKTFVENALLRPQTVAELLTVEQAGTMAATFKSVGGFASIEKM